MIRNFWLLLSTVIVCGVFIPSSKYREVVMWVIEGRGPMRAWISSDLHSTFRVTFTIFEARVFHSEEDAKHEILRLGLNGAWSAVRKGK